jgi:hypothetical protein
MAATAYLSLTTGQILALARKNIVRLLTAPVRDASVGRQLDAWSAIERVATGQPVRWPSLISDLEKQAIEDACEAGDCDTFRG